MWQALVDLLPDLKVGAFELRDVANLIVGVLGVILAYLAIRMGQRQAAIAEMQHKIWETEQAKQTDLRVIVTGQDRQWDQQTSDYGDSIVKLSVHNGGNRSADGFYWE